MARMNLTLAEGGIDTKLVRVTPLRAPVPISLGPKILFVKTEHVRSGRGKFALVKENPLNSN